MRPPLFYCRKRLDAVVVGAPVDDALLDGFRFQILGKGFVGEGWEFCVGGEAKGDELPDGEFVDVAEVGGGPKRGEAQALFDADDAVLGFEGGSPGVAGHHDEDDGHDDTPEMEVLIGGPVVHGDVDGEDEVEQEQGNDDEVKGRIVAAMVLQVLLRGHE
jgi:hypothetical protein